MVLQKRIFPINPALTVTVRVLVELCFVFDRLHLEFRCGE